MSATLTFTSPPPGFEPLIDFDLTEISGATGLYSLQSVTDADLRLFVLDAAIYLPEYSPEISDLQGSELGLVTGDDAMVLVVANPRSGSTTVNLAAPIVVNSETGRCAQVILDGDEWPLNSELHAAGA